MRMAAAADTVVPCTKPQAYVVRPPNAGFGLNLSMRDNECTFPCLTQGYDSDVFKHDGVQQVRTSKAVDQILNGL